MPPASLQEDVFKKIQTGLTEFNGGGGAPLLFGHLCKGDLKKPGVLRVSAVSPSGPAETAHLNIEAPCTHDDAFLRHVQRFGREKTLLHWLVCWTRAKLPDLRNGGTGVLSASFLIRDNGESAFSLEPHNNKISISLHKDILDSLAPKDLAGAYLKILYLPAGEYQKAIGSSVHCGRHLHELTLLSQQLLTLAKIQSCGVGNRAFGEACKAYLVNGDEVDSIHRLHLLSALQIAFLYLRVFDPECLHTGGIVSIARPHPDSVSDGSISSEAVPIFAVSTSANDSNGVSGLYNALTTLATTTPIPEAMEKVAAQNGTASGDGHRVFLKTGFKSNEELSGLIRERVPVPPFTNWSCNAASWIAHLVGSLRGARHEGGSLEFTFVLGDMAQIQDSADFELQLLTDARFEFPPDSNSNETQQLGLLDKAKKAIEKENYFWFQGGRYALLWDFTFPEKKPRYLLGLKDSSWQVFIANARNRKLLESDKSKAALIVGYLDGRGGGGLIIHGEHAFSLTKDGEWLQRGDKLSTAIDDYLKHAGKRDDRVEILSESERKTLVKALVAVSNDPDTGCMLVLANTETIPKFPVMGTPWKTYAIGFPPHNGVPLLKELPDQELVAMLGMDGAACVWKDGDDCRIAFRRLVRPDTGDGRKMAPCAEQNLSGEGSRKWSALLAATRQDVNLIIAVSQDGPVHFYCPAKFSVKSSDGVDSEHVIHDVFKEK